MSQSAIHDVNYERYVYLSFFQINHVVQLHLEVIQLQLLWSATVIVSLGGAAFFTEVLQSISICKEVLPLCLTFVTRLFIVFCHHDWVYSVKKCLSEVLPSLQS